LKIINVILYKLNFISVRTYLLILSGKINKIKNTPKLVDKSSYIDPSVRIFGINNIEIGKNTLLSENVWLNVNHRSGFEKKIRIGNNCHIGISNYFSCGPSIVLKDYCFTGIDCHFLGCGHKIENPLIPYLVSGVTSGTPIEIGVNCWLTTSVTIMEGVKIGYGSIIGARSVVTHNIPPFSLVIGNPGRVTKRFNFLNKQWIKISDWNEDFEKSIPTELEYLKIIKLNHLKIPMSIQATGKRFGWL